MSVDDVLAQRGKVYGDFQEQSLISREIGLVFCGSPGWGTIAAGPEHAYMEEALMMIAVKLARILNGDPDYVDNWDDIAGYATLVANQLRKDAAK